MRPSKSERTGNDEHTQETQWNVRKQINKHGTGAVLIEETIDLGVQASRKDQSLAVVFGPASVREARRNGGDGDKIEKRANG